MGNAVVTYVAYLWKTVWPSSLSIFYPFPTHPVSSWKIAGAVLLLIGITVFAFFQARRRPYLGVGWMWYLGTLVPVIGLVQVGNQAMGDRYTYIPLVGIFVAVVWGAADLAGRFNISKRAMAAAAGLWLLVLAGLSWVQVGYWRGPVPLFTHALEVTGDNWIAHHFLGGEALASGRYDEAIAHYDAVLRRMPSSVKSRNNLGLALMNSGRIDEAIRVLEESLRMDPGEAQIHFNLGVALLRRRRSDEAAFQFRETLRLNPHEDAARHNLERIGSGNRSRVVPVTRSGNVSGPARP